MKTLTRRAYTKVGDIFSVQVNDTSKKYFQYIANDLTQLNSDVIRVFKTKHSFDANPELSEITNDEVEFYAHCVINLGIKLNLWQKVENSNQIGNLEHILFRDSSDYGNPKVVVSEQWWIWRIGEEQKLVGKLVGANQKAEIGIVINPESIVYRIKEGKYDFKFYPGF